MAKKISKSDQINESGLSRLWTHYKNHDTGVITAFRETDDCQSGDPYTKEENKIRNSTLKQRLLYLNYGVTPIKGLFYKNYPPKKDEKPEELEESFFVVDKENTGDLLDTLTKLGEYFKQDSVAFADAGGKYYLISTNECRDGYPGRGKKGVIKEVGYPKFGKDGKMHSTVNNRPFIFESIIPNERLITISGLSMSEKRSAIEIGKRLNP
jgi:hypothetical protein